VKILVAGGAGFLGSHLCDRLLADGHEVTALDNLQTGSFANMKEADGRPGFSFWRHDITEPLPEWMPRERFDRVYNLACPASPPIYQRDPEHTMMTCVVGASALLRLAEHSGARFLQASTSEVYGDPDQHPQAETYRGNVNPTGPRACYDEGKRAAEALCFDFDRLGRAEVRVARIFNTYGPRLSGSDGRVVSNFIAQALAGEPLTIYGDGSQTRSFCYVTDTIDGLIRLMEHDGFQPGPVNIGNPSEITVWNLVEAVMELTATASWVERRPLPVDDPARRCPDIGKAFALLGWTPTISLKDGLRETVRWFRESAAA